MKIRLILTWLLVSVLLTGVGQAAVQPAGRPPRPEKS
jgi:hypothetical protein